LLDRTSSRLLQLLHEVLPELFVHARNGLDGLRDVKGVSLENGQRLIVQCIREVRRGTNCRLGL